MKIKGLLAAAATAATLLFSPSSSSADSAQIRCLAENIYHEARGEPRAGQIAVGNVVMNRVRSSRFPDTPCEVIRQRHGRTCQFSWVCYNRQVNNLSIYNSIYNIAESIYNRSIEDNTGGAQFFHSISVTPSWSRVYVRTVRIGSHIFYRGR